MVETTVEHPVHLVAAGGAEEVGAIELPGEGRRAAQPGPDQCDRRDSLKPGDQGGLDQVRGDERVEVHPGRDEESCALPKRSVAELARQVGLELSARRCSSVVTHVSPQAVDDPIQAAVRRAGGESEVEEPGLSARSVEAIVATHCARLFPTFYIKAAGEVDVATHKIVYYEIDFRSSTAT